MITYNSERLFLMKKCEIGHKQVTFSTGRYHHVDELALYFWHVHHMETVMAYHGVCLYEIPDGDIYDGIIGKIAGRIIAAKRSYEQKYQRDSGLSDRQIREEYIQTFGLRVFCLESRFYTGFICSSGVVVYKNGERILDSKSRSLPSED